MAGAVAIWSQTAATNATIDPTVNFREGQSPSTVNNSARAMMAAIARWRDDLSGNLETAGSSTAYTITSNQSLTPLADGYRIVARMHVTSGVTPTLNVDSTGAKAIRVYAATALPTGAVNEGSVHSFTYDLTGDCWYIGDFFTTTTLLLSGLQINGATATTAIAVDDELPIYDLSATANRKITVADFLKIINGLTAETAPAIADELALYDASATETNKITLADMLKVVDALTEDTTPNASTDFLLAYDTSATAARKVKPYSLIVPGALIAIIEDQKSGGVDGQTISASTTAVRVLNTLVYNRDTIVSLASNRFTLPAGTWEISWWCSASLDGGDTQHQSMLYNQSDATIVQRGNPARTDGGSTPQGATNDTFGSTVVTIAFSKSFEIRHQNGVDSLAGGLAAGFGTEVYARVTIRAA